MGAAISERPELLTKMDVEGWYPLSTLRWDPIRQALSRLVCWDVLFLWLHLFQRCWVFMSASRSSGFPGYPCFEAALFFRRIIYVGKIHLAPPKLGTLESGTREQDVTSSKGGWHCLKLDCDYTNVYRTHNSHLWANGDVSNGMRSVSWQERGLLRGRRNICVAGAAFILRDVAESDEKENEGRTNAGAKAPFRWAAGNGHFLHFSATFHLLGCFNLSWMKLDDPLNRLNFLWNLGRSSKLVTWRLRQKSSKMN